MQYRYKILALSSSILFSFYYVYDIPAALNKHLGLSIDRYGATKITLLYSVYALPNMILPLFFGWSSKIRSTRTTLLLCFLVFVGQSVFSLGVYLGSFTTMLIGRFIYGIGGESFTVMQNKLIANQFRGRELAFSMSLSSSIARCGTVMNYLVTPMLAMYWGKVMSCVFGTVMTMVGLGLCVWMVGKSEGVVENLRGRLVDEKVNGRIGQALNDEVINGGNIINNGINETNGINGINGINDINEINATNENNEPNIINEMKYGLGDEGLNIDVEDCLLNNCLNNNCLNNNCLNNNSHDNNCLNSNCKNNRCLSNNNTEVILDGNSIGIHENKINTSFVGKDRYMQTDELDQVKEHKKRKLTDDEDLTNIQNKRLAHQKNLEDKLMEDAVYAAWLDSDKEGSDKNSNDENSTDENTLTDQQTDDTKTTNLNNFDVNFININENGMHKEYQKENLFIPQKLNLYEENANSDSSTNGRTKTKNDTNVINDQRETTHIKTNSNNNNINDNISPSINPIINNLAYNARDFTTEFGNSQINNIDHWSSCSYECDEKTTEQITEEKPFKSKSEVDRSFPATVRKQIELDKPVQLYIEDDILYIEPDMKGKNAYNSGFPLLVAISFMFAVVWAPFSNIATMMFQKRYGVDTITAGRLMATQESMSLFLVIGVGLAADYMGLKLVFVGLGGILLLVAHFFIFYTYGSPFIPVIILGFAGPLISCYWPCIVYLVSPESIGTGFAIFTCVLNIAYTVSPILVSVLIARDASYDTVEFFILCMGVVAVLFVGALGMINRRMGLGLNKKSFVK